MKMHKIYQQLTELAKADIKHRKATLGDFTAKLLEEAGELAKEINRLTGRKKRDGMSEAEITERMTSEAADTIQCVMVLCAAKGIKYESLKNAIVENNKRYAALIDTKIS